MSDACTSVSDRQPPQTTPLPVPSSEDLGTFSVAQLEVLLIAWQCIGEHPPWQMWHAGANEILHGIRAELDRRCQERSRLALRRVVADWCVANDRFWAASEIGAASEAVEKLLLNWGDDRP